MTKKKSLFVIPLAMGMLYGCGNDQADKDEVVTDTTTTEETAQNETGNTTDQNAADTQTEQAQQVDTTYNFTHFDLDVEYQDDVSYNAEYENNGSQVAAELEDERNNVKQSGNDAYNAMKSQLESLTFDENTENQEVIDEVIAAFGLEEDFTEFDLEVKFVNGDNKQYEVNK